MLHRLCRRLAMILACLLGIASTTEADAPPTPFDIDLVSRAEALRTYRECSKQWASLMQRLRSAWLSDPLPSRQVVDDLAAEVDRYIARWGDRSNHLISGRMRMYIRVGRLDEALADIRLYMKREPYRRVEGYKLELLPTVEAIRQKGLPSQPLHTLLKILTEQYGRQRIDALKKLRLSTRGPNELLAWIDVKLAFAKHLHGPWSELHDALKPVMDTWPQTVAAERAAALLIINHPLRVSGRNEFHKGMKGYKPLPQVDENSPRFRAVVRFLQTHHADGFALPAYRLRKLMGNSAMLYGHMPMGQGFWWLRGMSPAGPNETQEQRRTQWKACNDRLDAMARVLLKHVDDMRKMDDRLAVVQYARVIPPLLKWGRDDVARELFAEMWRRFPRSSVTADTARHFVLKHYCVDEPDLVALDKWVRWHQSLYPDGSTLHLRPDRQWTLPAQQDEMLAEVCPGGKPSGTLQLEPGTTLTIEDRNRLVRHSIRIRANGTPIRLPTGEYIPQQCSRQKTDAEGRVWQAEFTYPSSRLLRIVPEKPAVLKVPTSLVVHTKVYVVRPGKNRYCLLACLESNDGVGRLRGCLSRDGKTIALEMVLSAGDKTIAQLQAGYG